MSRLVDITVRLRTLGAVLADLPGYDPDGNNVAMEAADEIDRLRARLRPTETTGHGCEWGTEWGNCADVAVGFRWSDSLGWLAVCSEHVNSTGNEGAPLEVEQ